MVLKYSVLMSVYSKENPEYFLCSVESMLNQTSPPDEIIIVKDGPLTAELDIVVDMLSERENITFVPLEKSAGLGLALAAGLSHCKNELVARMDSDDISLAGRCEKQLSYFAQYPNLSLVGTSIAEFVGEPDNIVSYKRVPAEFEAIKKYIRQRNPFNHMSVMFKKSDVLNAGSYRRFDLNEDYYLWLRMFLNGGKFANISEPLVNARINEDTFMRRGGWAYFITQKQLFDFMLENGVVSRFGYIYNIAVRFVVRVLVSNTMRKWLYLKLFRGRA